MEGEKSMTQPCPLAKWILAALFVAQLSLPLPLRANSFEERDPFNHIVILYDTTGSFKAHLDEAWGWVERLLKKFRKGRQDQITLIRLDGEPRVLFDLSAREVEEAHQKFLALKEGSKGCCTDVAGAFNLAAFVLKRDRWAGRKVLLVFSDLIHEPQGRPVPPPRELDWGGLQGVELVAYFVAPEQISPWKQLLELHKIQGELLAPAFSAHALDQLEPYEPPDPPVPEGSFLGTLLWWTLGSLGVLAGVALAVHLLTPRLVRPYRGRI